MRRIQKYASCSNECFILALIYIDRLIEGNNFLLTELNVHRVVITAILLAAKFFDDAYYNNAYYAKVGGVLVNELNGLEVDFLFRINFSLHVQPEEFEKYKAQLVTHSINSGIIPLASPVAPPHQLHNIPETDSDTTTQSKYNQQQATMQVATAVAVSTYDSIMTDRTQVTPSPNNCLQDTTTIGNTCGQIQTCSTAAGALVQAPTPRDQRDLHTMTAAKNSIQRTFVLERANSLPPFSSVRCVDHAFKLPYSAPAMPTKAPALDVDQMQYQMMMNQLFPIENTLVHHNHQCPTSTMTAPTNISNHHANPTGGLGGHHPGGVLGPMAYEVAWSG
ncbi:unnamed protein product [Pseudo-nitzschia multistriata]|uniref:Cyclin-like domain-containing protein n=1 Tax=Pseudo-nitzschia multistriata TaxID=183589 RepID=A0A448ZSB6_9STRA|nr:unnamed protein product [Pseudo-nitzschia multistriata]